MTQIVQLCCAHCGEGIDVAEPFQKLNTGPIQCPVCQSLNDLNVSEEIDGVVFYFEVG